MKGFYIKKTIKFAAIGVVSAVLLCGGLWLVNDEKTVRGGNIINIADLSDEFMEDYFNSYAEMTANGDQENILIVISYNHPDGYGAKDIVEGPNHTYYLMYDSTEKKDSAYEQLLKDDVISVEQNKEMQLAAYNSWGVEAMGLDHGIRSIGVGGGNVKIAIIDTGLDVTTFRNNYPDKSLYVYDVESDSTDYEDMQDTDGHGTHIAGTIAEGTPGRSTVMAIRAQRDNKLYTADVNTAINRAANNGADVINMSLGSYDYSDSQRLAIDAATSRNVVVVAAAGNDNTSTLSYPASYDNTISVAALDTNYSRAVWDASQSKGSNFNELVDYAAPGTAIKSINGYMNGTSMAAPHVAAAVAIMKSYNDDLNLNAVNELLRAHVRDLGSEGKDIYYGYGMIDFSGAEFCDDGYCDEYGVFASDVPIYTRAEISNEDIILTPLNYYSIQNLLLTKVKLYTDATNYVTMKLQDVESLVISGYDAESTEEQEVTINCEGVSTTIRVTNPADYPAGWKYIVNEDDEVLLTDYDDIRKIDYDNEIMTKIYVPSQIDGKNVVALYSPEKTVYYGENDEYSYITKTPVFSGEYYTRDQTREVYLPTTVTRIDDETFAYFGELRKIVMEADAVGVGENAFYSAHKLKTVDGKISQLGERAFSGAEVLKAVELADGMTEIPNHAFSDCASLEEISIPSTVTSIGYYSFNNNSSLTRVEFLGNNIKTIGNDAFARTTKLRSITLPEGLERIEFDAFYKSGITSVYIPASVTYLASGIFDDCGNLNTIIVNDNNQIFFDISDMVLLKYEYSDIVLLRGTKYFAIPVGTTRIDSGAFSGITTLMNPIVIPDSVRSIYGRAFYGCTGLTEVTIPKGANLSSGAFAAGMDENYNYINLDVKLNVYNNSPAYTYATSGEFEYTTLDASYARVVDPFNYGDTLLDSTEVEMYYDYGTKENGTFVNHTGVNGRRTVKRVSDMVSTAYSGDAEYFRIGDTYFDATYKDLLNSDATTRVNVTVIGEYPTYTIPTGLTGKYRKYTNTIELPEGFSWMRDVYMGEMGEHTFLARYTPSESETYAPVDNIEITVDVVPGRTKLPDPEITVASKVFDDGWDIDSEYITVNIDGLDEDDYDVSGWTYDKSGITTAVIYIYLSWDTAENYGFGDNYESSYYYEIENYEILEPTLDVHNLTEETASVAVLSDGITVTADKACIVAVTNDGGETYTKVPAVEVDTNVYKFEFEITSETEVTVTLKGNLNSNDQAIDLLDANVIYRSLLNPSSAAYRALSPLENALADLNGDGVVDLLDANVIYRSLLNHDSMAYSEILW